MFMHSNGSCTQEIMYVCVAAGFLSLANQSLHIFKYLFTYAFKIQQKKLNSPWNVKWEMDGRAILEIFYLIPNVKL